MNVRRTLVATSVLVGLLASAADAAGTVTLDGKKRTVARYEGDLEEFAYSTAAASRTDPTVPAREDCTEQSCDIKELRLSVPKGSPSGRFRATLTADRALNAAFYLYGSKGQVLASADTLKEPEASGEIGAEPDDLTYTLTLTVARLIPGKYALTAYNRGGSGHYLVEITYYALPPPRRPVP